MHYHIDKTAAQSAYLQLYHQLRRDIVSGVYPLGTKMPSKRLIATETGVSVITVEHALAILCDEGYLESRERSGFFVSFAAADCFPVSETETERRTTVSHGTEDEFPFPSLAKTMRRVLSEYGESILVKSPNNGCAELRGTIAAYLSRSRGISVQPGQIVIGSGAEYLYGLIVQLLGRSHVYALENPGYPQLAAAYQANDVFCRYLPMDAQGIRADVLENSGADILHISPSHQFPTGIVMPVSRRYELLRWAAKKSSRYIIEDDYDCEFRLFGKPIPPLQSIDTEEKVIYINTFSKTLAPTFRISYMLLPPHLASLFYDKLGFYSCTVSNFEQFTLAKFIEDGYFERHINRMRTYYRSKRDRLLQYLTQSDAAPALTVEGEDSGLHFLLHLATDAKDSQLVQATAAKGIQIKFLSDYYHEKIGDSSHTLLMNYTGLAYDKLYPALDTLFTVLKPYLKL